ncbi:MAG: hypothetical protein SFW65_08150 [Alphaproteobacteria bacterium]|nr:hypothetical protein [Alphaproteobacteria bacterium]
MKNKFALAFAGFLLCVASPFAALAEGTTADILELVQNSRAKVSGFLSTDDENVRSTLLSEISASTIEVDMRTDTMINDDKTPEETKQRLLQFKSVWAEFVQTRDGEMIPAAQEGDKEKARNLGQTVQMERFKKIQTLLK